MARLTDASGERLVSIRRWLGLNESPDGDSALEYGEAAAMRNFRVTRENHLQLRPGYAVRHTLGGGAVRCLWSGYVAGRSVLLAVCAGHLWQVDGDTPVDCGAVKDGPAFLFGFARRAYLLAGGEYYAWDGERLRVVEGYIPLAAVAAPPEGGGTALEPVNALTGKRRQRFSPNGTDKVFHLTEAGLSAVLSVERTDGGAVGAWTADPAAGTVTFSAPPAAGTDCLTITYDTGESSRSEVTAMAFAELYGGTADDRVFLYGDGSNRAFYSELDGDGQPSAEYFPPLNLLHAGSANTPITGMIRHFSKLLVFKPDGAFSVSAAALSVTGGADVTAFYLTPVQRNAGCSAPGLVRLVTNNPRTVWGGAVYDWSSTSGYLASSDERVVRRISQRVESTLQGWDLSACTAFDDEYAAEWYLLHKDEALIHNYGNDTWYFYDHFPAACMARHGGEIYFGTPDGRLMHLSRQYRNDAGTAIDAYWESGAMDFGEKWARKFGSHLWASIQPEGQGRVTVTAQSDRRSEHARAEVAAGLSTFRHASFAHWSFRTNRKPRVQRIRLKVGRFVFYKLILESRSTSSTATVLSVDLRVRRGGTAK